MGIMRLSVVAVSSILLLSQQHNALASSLDEQVNIVRQINDQKPVTDVLATATNITPSEHKFTIPSLWWQQQQQGEAINRRLIDSWRAYDSTISPIPHVDVIVNGQIWPLLSYLEQYVFIRQFGESTHSYGYQLRIFTGESLVGLHICNFSDNSSRNSKDVTDHTISSIEHPQCKVELDNFG
ncbi:MAG: hypothetical protein F6K11_01425 [Leptolyngbya sp. SIO3F4]|nr:hypothetical protein [Leptolyngbya sp. SIO3F4]